MELAFLCDTKGRPHWEEVSTWGLSVGSVHSDQKNTDMNFSTRRYMERDGRTWMERGYGHTVCVPVWSLIVCLMVIWFEVPSLLTFHRGRREHIMEVEHT